MKTHHNFNSQPIVALLILLILASRLSTALAAGPLTPPGPPAPLWKTLQEIEPRTIIASVPYTILGPGAYYFSNNLTVATGSAIIIESSGVTLDLNGFTLSSSAPIANGEAIVISGNFTNITILNGTIAGGVTDNGSGTYSGPGFGYGIYGPAGANIRVSHVTVSGCLYDGIDLNFSSSVIEKSVVSTVGGRGIGAQVVAGCSASDCGSSAIYGIVVSDSSGQSAYSGDGIDATTVINSYGTGGAKGTYVGVSATDAQNCYGFSSVGNGLYASTANNCYGDTSATNAYGIFATDAVGCLGIGGYAGIYCTYTASSCYGQSYYGYGLETYNAENCSGYCFAPSGGNYAGLYARTAHNCYGYGYYQAGIQVMAANNCYGTSTYGYGIDGKESSLNGPIENCYGYGYYSVGISAYLAENSYGQSQTSDGMDVTLANNCYGYTTSGYGGLFATCANNCYGYVSSSSTSEYAEGINATSVNNCYGFCGSTGSYGYGIDSTIAQNCYGYSSSPGGVGLYGYISIGSYGYDASTGSLGLEAYVANSSVGAGATAESVSFKYNMP